MKKFNLILVSLFLVMIFSCKAQQILQPNLAVKILGTWISNDEPEYKIEFTNNGLQREYINNKLQQEVYSYKLISTCGNNTRNNNELFLKIFTNENDATCDFLNGIHTDSNGVKTLSITTERGKLYLFTKQ